MKKFLLHIILLILGFHSFSEAQNPYSKNFIDSSEISLKECIRLKNYDCYILGCIKISDAFLYQGKSDSSLHYIDIIKPNEIKGAVLNFEYYNQLGSHYSSKSLYFSGLQYAFKGLFFSEQIEDKMYRAKSYTLIANLNGLLNQNKEALSWHFKALPIYEHRQQLNKYYLTINNMGNCYKRMENYTQAIKLYQKALVYKLRINDLFWQGVLYANLGETYLKKKDFKNALIFTKNALNINISRKDTMSIFTDEVQMADAFDGFGNVEQSLLYAKKAESISQNIDMIDEKIMLFDLLSKIYDRKKNYAQSLYYLKKNDILKQKKYEGELEKKIAAQKIDYDLLNEKQKNENQKNTISLQTKNNNNLKIASILLSVFLLIIFYFYQNQKKQNSIIKVQTEQIKEINLDLEQKVVQRTSELMLANQSLLSKNEEVENALYLGKKQERDQIAGQLHDNLGGYLSAIRYNMMAIDSENLDKKEKKIFDNIKKMIDTAHDEVRYLSHNIMPKDLEEEGIVFCLKKLAKQLTETEKISFMYTGPNILKIDLRTEYEIYSICLELTNNILKHSKASEGGYMIDVYENKKNIYIFDNGIGLSDGKSGFGIENLQTRLQKMNAELTFTKNIPTIDKEYSTVVKITI